MVDVVLQGVWVLYCINKDEGNESLSLLAFQRDFNAIFMKYSKEGRFSSMTHVGIRNIPSDVCYDDTKHFAIWCNLKKQGRYKVCKKNSQCC